MARRSTQRKLLLVALAATLLLASPAAAGDIDAAAAAKNATVGTLLGNLGSKLTAAEAALTNKTAPLRAKLNQQVCVLCVGAGVGVG